jgi:hypothetical protein
MVDTDYDGLSFYASQVFFPKTSAWDNLQRSLKATFDESVWSHLSSTVSEALRFGWPPQGGCEGDRRARQRINARAGRGGVSAHAFAD